ncbi:hypothetical protein Aph02nite_36510 [Actinoplanes philippinensis]|uniref:Barstar (Barnase inhibitor) n=1 Tax=Actinoplanes philippinensis TaxID=35752 RepID=A0A1I2FGZ3_9ACTN|nr:hypothetical protein [Actinoplanes philippinensis]GIE77701.1 hypothetical protein Aph02nite_36510 [Actinoplanes philippinensis]SFF03731.1 hypothetical protein SAMN05421541_105341 [Actinoplanes philippinensis]
MADDEDLPVLVVDGAAFSDLEGFAREISKLIPYGGTWNGNLNDFDGLLRGKWGPFPEGGWVFRWVNSDLSRTALGYEATAVWREGLRRRCHPSHREGLEADIAAARRGEGETLFDMIVEMIRAHGAGGEEWEDNVVLELV